MQQVEVTINIRDDAPELTVRGNETDVTSASETLVGTYTLTHSADGDTVSINGTQANEENGVYTAEVDGIGTVTLKDGKVYVTASEGYASSNDVKLTITVTDSDNDTVSDSLTFDMSSVLKNQEASVTTDDTDLRNGGKSVAKVIASEKLGEDWVFSSDDLPEVENGQLSVDDNGNLVYTQTEALTNKYLHSDNTPGTGTDESAEVGTVKVTVENKVTGATQQVEVTINIRDDAPELSVTSGSTVAGPTENLSGTEGGYDFVEVVTSPSGSLTQYTNNAEPGQNVAPDILKGVWDGVTIYAGKVTYQETGNRIFVSDLQTDLAGYQLQYSQYGGYTDWSDNNKWKEKGGQDWGIMVTSPDENTNWGNDKWSAAANFETEADLDENYQPISSEAIIINLGGKLAYGTSIDFGAFYSNFKDEGMERALLTFYKGGKIVGSRIVEGSDSGSENKVVHSEEFLAGGFDKIVISALGNVNSKGEPTGGKDGPQGSSFTIQGIDFVTAPEPLYVTEGTVSSVSGADGYDDAFADSHVQFAMDQMFTEKSEGEYTLTVFVNGEKKDASVECQTDDSGNSRLTATVDGEQIFSATLEPQPDGTYTWKMEQYKEFSVGNDGQNDSFQLGFITQDGDGDTAVEYADVPLNTEIIAGESGSDITVSDVDNAGLVVTGDGGDTSVTMEGVVSNSTNYNICFLLDISESMDATIGTQTRYDVAIGAIEQYVNSIIVNESYIGTVNIAIIPFASKANPENFETIELTIIKEEGSTTINGQDYSTEWSMGKDWHNVEKLPSGTNYAAAFQAAGEWYSDLGTSATDGKVENLTYFLTDGFPNKSLNANTFDAAKDAYVQYNGLINLVQGEHAIKVHAIGIGGGGGTEDVLTDKAMESLSIFDNTGEIDDNPGIIWHNTDGSRAYLIKDTPINNVDTYNELQQYLDKNASKKGDTGYFIKVSRDEDGTESCYYQLTWNEHEGEWGFWEYQNSTIGSAWTSYDEQEREWKNDYREFTVTQLLVTAGTVSSGVSEKIDSADGLNAALAGGLTLVPAFADLTDSVIDASQSESSVNVIYGDVMNTDNLVTGENGAEIGMGYDNFEKTGWSSEDITKYIQDHAEDLGRETLLVATSTDGQYDTYYRDVHGDVYKLGDYDKPLNADELKDLIFIGREGGDDTITGTAHDDLIFGQEGNDYINGGDGSDKIYGGSGNDIIVYDSNDYLVDGGSGIDVLISGAQDTPSLDTLLAADSKAAGQPLVNGVEVLITGNDALGLTSMDKLAQYGITIGKDGDKDALVLDGNKWSEDSEGTYHYNGDTGVDLNLQTTIQTEAEWTNSHTDVEAAVQQQVLILQNSNS